MSIETPNICPNENQHLSVGISLDPFGNMRPFRSAWRKKGTNPFRPLYRLLCQIFLLDGVSLNCLSPFLSSRDQIRLMMTCKVFKKEYPKHIQRLNNVPYWELIYTFPNLRHVTIRNSETEPCIMHIPVLLQSLVFETQLSTVFSSKHSLANSSIKSLTFKRRFKGAIEPGGFPKSLHSLHFHSSFEQKDMQLPSDLQHLTIGSVEEDLQLDIKSLPRTLKTLTLQTHGWKKIQPNELPNSLIKLSFTGYFNSCLLEGVLPDSIRYLDLGNYFSKPLIAGSLPKTLKELEFGWGYNTEIDKNVLPASLETLSFGSDYNKAFLPGVLPQQLKVLNLGSRFSHPFLPDILPKTLQTLSLGAGYRTPFKPGVLPDSLKNLVVSDKFTTIFTPGSVPSSLQTLALTPF